MIVMVTGSRSWPEENRYQIEMALAKANPSYLIVGDAKGADKMAREWADRVGCRYTVFKANWKSYGKGAGPLRNQAMVDQNPALVLAFPVEGSKGTFDAVDRAERKGIYVVMVPPDSQ